MSSDLRIVFMGTPDFAVGILDELVNERFNIVGVVTTPDKPAGRGQHISESAVKKYTLKLDVPILQPEKLSEEQFISQLRSLNADLFIVVAFRMLPEIVWSMPPKGTINLHASLLPQYRGAAPINWAIINGEKKTGVTTFFIEKEIDTGLILAKEEVNINSEMTAGDLHDELMLIGKRLVIKSVNMITNNDFRTIAQSSIESGALKPAPKIFKQDCFINWNQKAEIVHNFIRGLSPYPTAWTTFLFVEREKEPSVKIFMAQISDRKAENSKEIILLKDKILIPCADFYLEILSLQIEGKRKMDALDFISGYNHEIINVKF